jgi:hypothetical protein
MKITITVERQGGDHQSVTLDRYWVEGNLEWHQITTSGLDLLKEVAGHFGDVGQRPSWFRDERVNERPERGGPVPVGDVQVELDRLQERRNRGAGPR